jgi:hypothetical protein
MPGLLGASRAFDSKPVRQRREPLPPGGRTLKMGERSRLRSKSALQLKACKHLIATAIPTCGSSSRARAGGVYSKKTLDIFRDDDVNNALMLGPCLSGVQD